MPEITSTGPQIKRELNLKVLKKYSRNYLVAASAYRRMARERRLSFSEEMLDQQYRHETFGEAQPDPKVNGYTCGKWVLDATLKQMYQDFKQGLFTKDELKEASSYFVRREVSKWGPSEFYGHRAFA